jgi:hypothetical protein
VFCVCFSVPRLAVCFFLRHRDSPEVSASSVLLVLLKMPMIVPVSRATAVCCPHAKVLSNCANKLSIEFKALSASSKCMALVSIS